jgi:hypothetical protein
MRYLYGDSVPFPQQYDFLAALDVFCTQAARIVRIDAESARLQKTTDEAAVARTRAIDGLEAFHREAVRALREGAKDQGQPLVDDYVRQIADLAQRMVDESRRSAMGTNDREQKAAQAECDRRGAEARDALEKLLVAVRLPALEVQIRMSLVAGQGPEFSGVFTFEGGLVAVITLAGEAVEEWRSPRRVGDIAPGLSLPVGVRRSLFKRTVAPETISLDEYYLGGFDLADERAELRLRKKPELGDSLVFVLERTDDRVVAEVHHPDDAEAESGLPSKLDPVSSQEMERLWQLVRSACGPLVSRKKHVTALTLGGTDVFAAGLGTNVVALVVGSIAPVVLEIGRRSPNSQELSLKLENDNGRREEIYLKKGQLVSALATVPAPESSVFEPLGILPSDKPQATVLIDGQVPAVG